jgi:hypothetical protein
VISDPNCTCESIDVRLASRCAHCRFEACEMFTYTEAPDAEFFETPGAALKVFRDGIDPLMVPEVEIFGYLKKRLDPKLYERQPKEVLQALLEVIHEEYGDPENNYEPCANMTLAAQDFVDVVLDHYEVWQCELKPLASKIFKTRSK